MDNKIILKWLFVLVTSPLWWPVLKTLWREANKMLVDDGGVFGPPPNPLELDEIRREIAAEGDPLVSEPILTAAERQRGGRGLGARSDPRTSEGGGRPSGSGRGARRGGAAAQRGKLSRNPRRGFR